MVANFRKHWGNEIALITTGLDAHQTVTLASIVETEAQLPQERPVVASVYLNRVRKRMLLGADPTVIYALKLAGRWDGNIRKADLQIDSPYNTYRKPGLPPGPIANPGLASLRAAAAPATTPYLYFVARNDGSHVFSTNNDEHNRNVEKYQRQYFRDKRAELKQRRGNTARPTMPSQLLCYPSRPQITRGSMQSWQRGTSRTSSSVRTSFSRSSRRMRSAIRGARAASTGTQLGPTVALRRLTGGNREAMVANAHGGRADPAALNGTSFARDQVAASSTACRSWPGSTPADARCATSSTARAAARTSSRIRCRSTRPSSSPRKSRSRWPRWRTCATAPARA